MIIFDTETTGLMQPGAVPISEQPQMIEFGAIKVDEKLEEVARLSFLVNPGIPLPAIITKITGIKDRDLKGKPPFAHYYQTLVQFFLGEEILVAHNCAFDLNILELELKRMGCERRFPWPWNHICTVELTHHIKQHRLSMEKLYKHYFGTDPQQTHRAIEDVEILLAIVRHMRKVEGII